MEAAPRRALRRAVLAWFDREGRELTFRRTADPYAVLVSEVMLQQTQVGRVERVWPAFVARFPTITTLAEARTAEVLRAWAGMGYNRRALSLQRAARTVVERHGGALPGTVADLRALPGVGPYTARAVAAIAFGLPVAAVDTNIRRVVGRIVASRGARGDPGAPGDPSAPAQAPILQAWADELVDPGRPGDWTHALMDLGAILCRPRAPRCPACPAARFCRFAAGRVAGAGTRSDSREARGRGPDAGAPPAPPRATPYPATIRWLRGRIVARLRETPDGAYVAFHGPLGGHPPERVAATLRQLATEGLLELDRSGRARLPLAAGLSSSGASGGR